MSHDLAKIVHNPIQTGVGWTFQIRNCTNAVVCWLWCLEHQAFAGASAASGANPNMNRPDGIAYQNRAHNPVPAGNFLGFLIPPSGKTRSTNIFLYKMATQVGHLRWTLSTFSLRQGMLVLWVKKNRPGIVAHAGINGGNNEICGYNQLGAYYDPECGSRPGFHTHGPNHWCSRKAVHMNWKGYKIYTVGAADAMAFFNRYHDHRAIMW